jgi:ubiquitin-activating enzyme E1
MHVDEFDADVVSKVVRFSDCSICPMSAFFGGIVAQEVVKFTGKYSPLK